MFETLNAIPAPVLVIGTLVLLLVVIALLAAINGPYNDDDDRDRWEEMKIAKGIHPSYDRFGNPRR